MGSLVCVSRSAALGLLPVLVASMFLARGFVRRPLFSAGFAVMGTVALGSLVIHIGCRSGSPLHVLLSHALTPLFLGFLLAIPVGWLIRRQGAVFKKSTDSDTGRGSSIQESS
jgi:hypothetical protein